MKDINENELSTVDGGLVGMCFWFSPVPVWTVVGDDDLCIGVRIPVA
jgi:hypothetical protein